MAMIETYPQLPLLIEIADIIFENLKSVRVSGHHHCQLSIIHCQFDVGNLSIKEKCDYEGNLTAGRQRSGQKRPAD